MLDKRKQTEQRRTINKLDQILNDIEEIRLIATINTATRLMNMGLTEIEQDEWFRVIRENNCLGMQFIKLKGENNGK